MDPVKPGVGLLCTIGSIIVHFDEGTESGGHPVDIETARQLLATPEVTAWLAAMRRAALLPEKR